MNIMHLRIATLIILNLLASLPVLRAGDVKVEDDFSSYTGIKTGNRPFTESWKLVKGSSPILEARFTPKSKTQLVLGNGVVARELRGLIKDHFELEVKLLHTRYMRYQWVGLFNQSMMEGYAIFWDSGSENVFAGRGSVGISRIQLSDNNELGFLTHGEPLAKPAGLNNAAFGRYETPMEEPFLTLRLTWNKSSGELVAECGGKQIVSAINSDFAQFETLVIGGNEKGIFESVTVSGR